MEEEEQKRPSQTYFLLPLLQYCSIHDVDNVDSSHLIKLMHGVQKKKKCTYAVKVGKLSNTN